MEEAVRSFLEQVDQLPLWMAYLFFFGSGLLQVFFPPYPGEVVIAFCGYFGSQGMFGGYIPNFLSIFSATILGSFLLFQLGAWKGEAILRNKYVLKYFPEKIQEKSRSFVTKYGIMVYLVAKFIPGVNIPVTILTGMIGYKRSKAFPAIFVVALIHDMAFFTSGVLVGHNWATISGFFATYKQNIIILAAIALVLYITYRLVMNNIRKKKNEAA